MNIKDLDIRDLDTSRFQYDPKNPYDIERLKRDIPEFAEHPTIDNKKIKAFDQDDAVRYVILLYDRESQLRREYTKIRQRKAVAAAYAGFKPSAKGEFRKDVERILIGQSPEVNKMIVRYVMSYNDPDQMALEMYIEMFQRNAAAMLQNIADPMEYKRIHEVTEKLKASISELTQKLLGGQDESSIIKELYADLQKLRETMMPEYVAEIRAKGQDLEYNPYGSYEPEPLRLVKQDHEFKANEE